MRVISFDDIREGDRIGVKQLYEKKGVKYERDGIGVAECLSDGVWSTDEGGILVSVLHGTGHTITLIDRPKPPLPTTPGTVFRATEIRGEKCDVIMFVRQHVTNTFRRVYISARPIDQEAHHSPENITAWEPIENGDK